MNMINQIKTKFWTRHVLWCNNAILIYLALAKLVVHLLTSTGYGYFGDELYWLDMAKHLDFGYVDVPPLVAYLGAVWRFLFGASLFAIHLLPAIAGAITIFFAGLIARELGGGRFAQWFSALTLLVAPWLLTINSYFTYDSFDQLCSIILFYLIVRIINSGTPARTTDATWPNARRWLLLGIIAGLGVMTKLSMIYTGGALVISMLLTSNRKNFLTVWPWLAALITALICTPYLIWQSVHGWPLLHYVRIYALNSIRPHPQPVQFFTGLGFFILNPFLIPVWLFGLYFTLFHGEGKRYRMLGFTFLILALFYTGLAKLEPREILSACFPILAAGAVFLEKMFSGVSASAKGVNTHTRGKSILWLKQGYIGVILVSAALMAPISLPILPIPVLEKYWSATPAFIRESDFQLGVIPQHFRFSLGWPEMVKEVATVYDSLSEDERKKCMIWAGFYWDTGAIDLLGNKYGLPAALSNCQSYQIWGIDHLSSGKVPEVAIMLQTAPNFPAWNYFEEVTPVKSFTVNKDSVYPNFYLTLYICRKPKPDFLEAWKKYEYYF
ncbi:MAG TPA: glycosyltransferase family 39 protein [Bacillota bacterium]|nr:glycosyltransferase family 39 protein [Bacillota bacterium]